MLLESVSLSSLTLPMAPTSRTSCPEGEGPQIPHPVAERSPVLAVLWEHFH